MPAAEEGTLKRAILWVFAGLVVVSSWPALAQESAGAPPAVTEQERRLEEAKKEKFPIGAGVSLTQEIGGGTFIDDPYVRRASYDVSLGLAPYWRITPMMRLTAGLSISQSVVENYESSVTYKNRLLLSDLSLGLSHAQLFKIPVLDIGVNGGLGIGFPTSLQSQYRTLLLSSNARLGMGRSIGPVYIAYGISFFKNFNQYTQPVIDKSKAGEHVVLAHYQGNEQLTTDLVAVGGANTSFGLVNSIMASWNITDALSFGIMYAYNNSWTYTSYPKDELSAEYADGGQGYRDSQQGVLDLSYQFNDYVSASIGTATMVSPKSADNKAYVFPFANFWDDYRRNSTSVYVSLGGNF